jgi:hypothetical protein
LRGRGVGIWSLRSGLWGRWLPLSSLGLELMRVEERERLHRTRPTTQTHREAQHCGHDSGVWRLMMAGVPADTQGSTALKALATDKISTCILQSANLLHLLRNSSHSEVRIALSVLGHVQVLCHLSQNPNQLGRFAGRRLGEIERWVLRCSPIGRMGRTRFSPSLSACCGFGGVWH